MALTFIDDTGFTRARLDQRLAALTSAVRAIFGTDIDLSPESPDGQLLGVFAELISDADSLAEAVYNGRSPGGARGAALARLSLLNGVIKKSAQFSTVTLSVTGTNGTVIPIGSLVGHATDSTIVFQTTAAMTISGGVATGAARSSTAGPVRAGIGTLTARLIVISGWATVTNAADATVGQFEETDPALRTRRAASVALPSQGILDGLEAALAQTADVIHAKVYENPEETVDANGLPPHSINAIVDGGAAADIGLALWLKKSLGVTQVGAQTQVITDVQGFAHTMRWDTPLPVTVYVTVQLDVPVGSATKATIAAAIVAYGDDASDIGADVEWFKLSNPINSVPGLSVAAVFLGSSPGPTLQANLAVAFNAIATWDAARINVTP